MARRTLRAVARQLGEQPPGPDRTADVTLPGAERVGPDAESYRQARTRALVQRGVAPATAARLTWLYGGQLDELLALGDRDPSWLEPLHPEVPALRGEALLAAQGEMATTLADFMDRRAALLLFGPGQGEAAARAAADVLGEALGWSGERRARELESYARLAAEHGPPAAEPAHARGPARLTDQAP
jgi:glycerol-3-phosphate dehydrogenase